MASLVLVFNHITWTDQVVAVMGAVIVRDNCMLGSPHVGWQSIIFGFRHTKARILAVRTARFIAANRQVVLVPIKAASIIPFDIDIRNEFTTQV